MAMVGIDLGTTNSLVSVWKDGASRLIENALGVKLTPSVVGLDDDGRVLVGQAAKERLITHPELTAARFKRYMGSDKSIRLGDRCFRAEELSSFVLKSLKEDAEHFLGERVEEAVISVPAYFNDAQRKATRAAGKLAGLQVERLINEPTAAAMAYGMHEASDESTFLVLDLGGGTFDVSVLELFDGVMEVHATAGDNFLGGEDFTDALVKAVLDQDAIGTESVALAPAELNRLRKAVEQAKVRLSDAESTTVQVHWAGQEHEWTLSRGTFEGVTEALVARLRGPLERALGDAKLEVRDLDGLVLVGGATRMPLVRSLAAKLFGRFPLTEVHPDEAVAIGAAIQAGLKSRDSALSETVLTDVCPYSLGTAVAITDAEGRMVGQEFSPILERNTVVPASREKIYVPIDDAQTAVRFDVYQGESRKVEDNIRLGSVTLPLPSGGNARSRELTTRYTYDINGLLEVDVQIKDSGTRKTLVIEENPGVLTPEEIEERLRALASLKIHPREQMKNRTLLARGERLYEEALGERRGRIGSLLSSFETVLAGQNPDEVERAQTELAQELDRLEEGVGRW